MKVRFIALAETDLTAAIEYYDGEVEGLGEEFEEEIYAALERIKEYPKAWTPLSKRTRRCQTHRFPYGIIYQIREEELMVVAVTHLHSEPDQWKSRLQKNFR